MDGTHSTEKTMINFLELALNYADKKQWTGSEVIWLVKLTDPLRSKLYRIQGVYLAHHRIHAEVHLHCTPRDDSPRPKSSLLVFKLDKQRLNWTVNPDIDDDYVLWSVEHGIELGNIEYLQTRNKI